jgi:epoxyqueuosine reductase QueG
MRASREESIMTTPLHAGSLNRRLESFLLERGALKVGVATVETLAGSPPSADLTYKLESARSAISFALPLDKDAIRAYLAKRHRLAHERDLARVNIGVTNLSWELARMLQADGYEARGTSANFRYRTEVEDWQTELFPDVSHRYIAVASGVGSFGWSGNVGVEGHGCAIAMGTTLTSAELEPTPPIPEGEGFCEDCRLCVSACAVGMFDKKEEMSFELASRTYSYSARRDVLLCHLCCGGYTGLHESGKWSTWSPGRFPVPRSRDEVRALLEQTRELARRWPERPGGFPVAPPSEDPDQPQRKAYTTCGNCALICFGDKKENARNLKLLRKSGCFVPRADGTFAVLRPDQAAEEFEKLDSETRALYR